MKRAGKFLPSVSKELFHAVHGKAAIFFTDLVMPRHTLASTASVSLEKARLRSQLRQMRRELAPARVADLSQRITERFLRTKAWQEAQSLALYIPKLADNEVDTRALLHAALFAQKHVFLPKVLPDNQLAFLPWTDETPLVKNRFGLLEPQGETLGHATIELFVLPGLAFDRQGTRLGFGGGYYDRALAQRPGVLVAGICYGFQLVETLPSNTFDQSVNLICTEDELLCL